MAFSTAGRRVDRVDDVRHVRRAVVPVRQDVARGGVDAPLLDLREPAAAVALLHQRQQLLAAPACTSPDDAHVGRHVLVDLRRVDVHVDHVGVLRVGRQVARDAVVEAHAQRDQQVGVLDGLVDEGLAVHAHHAQVQRVRLGHRADAQQGGRDGNLALFGQGAQLIVGAGEDDAVAGQDDGALGGVDEARPPCAPALPARACAGGSRADAA